MSSDKMSTEKPEEGQPNYESVLGDFLDQEIAATTKPATETTNAPPEDVDMMVASLLQEVMKDSGDQNAPQEPEPVKHNPLFAGILESNAGSPQTSPKTDFDEIDKAIESLGGTAPREEIPAKVPIKSEPVAAPHKPEPVAAPHKPEPVAAPSKPEPVAALSKPAPVAAPVKPAPVAAPVKEKEKVRETPPKKADAKPKAAPIPFQKPKPVAAPTPQVASTPVTQTTPSSTHAPLSQLASASTQTSKFKPIALAACAGVVIIIGLGIYFFTRPEPMKTAAAGNISMPAVTAPAVSTTPVQDTTVSSTKTRTSPVESKRTDTASNKKTSQSASSSPVAKQSATKEQASVKTAAPAPIVNTPPPAPQVIQQPVITPPPAIAATTNTPVEPKEKPSTGATIEVKSQDRQASVIERITPGSTEATPLEAVAVKPTTVNASADSKNGANNSAANVVTTAPKAVTRINPIYPDIARRMRLTGTVVLELKIDVNGKVTEATPVSGNNVLATAAVDACKQWRYIPAQRNGKNVESSVRVSFNF